jgi:hypothetical protein
MDIDPPLTVDYIFIRTQPKEVADSAAVGESVTGHAVSNAYLFGDLCDPKDATIYPSDHIGVFVKVGLTFA